MLRFLFPSFLLTALAAQAASVTVPAGGNLQAALNQARAGDTITLTAGATYTGHFRVPNNTGATITVQSSAMSAFAASQRVSPSQSASFAKLVTPDSNSVLVIAGGANNYRLQGIEMATTPGVYVQDLVQSGTASETSASQLPNNIDFDRCYLHGDPVSGGKRGIALNSANTTVENSYFADFISTTQDTQALAGWNGAGPFLIQNNHLEAGTEIVAFGGAVPAIVGLIPSNITIQNNEFYKPTRYYQGSPDYAGVRVWSKNMIEFKNGQQALIQNNTFTNNFVQADQRGFALVLNVRDESGQVPWATVSNITVAGNRFDHMPVGALFLGRDADGGGTAHDIHFENNLWTNLGVYGGDGRLYEILDHVDRLTIDHDTAFPTGYLLVFDLGPSSGLSVTNGIYTAGLGIAGNGTGAGEATLAHYEPDGIFENNLVIGGSAAQFSGAHFAHVLFASDTSQVGFTLPSAGDYSLAANSPYHGAALDGKDLGDTALSSSSSGKPATIPTGWTQIVSKASSKCLNVRGDSTTAGAQVWQWACFDGPSEHFQLVPVNGDYQILIQVSGLSLNIWGGHSNPTTNGLLTKQWSFSGDPNELFRLEYTADGYWLIHPVNSLSSCLNVAASSTANGASVQQWTCSGGDNQKWSFRP